MLYDFTCDNCGDIELIVSLGTEQVVCPNCGSQAPRSHKPVLSNFTLVGNNWSRDGYTSTEEKKAAGHKFVDYQCKLDGKKQKPMDDLHTVMEDN